jgi:hypothetical protein
MNTNYDYTKLTEDDLQSHINMCVNGAYWIKNSYLNTHINNYLDVPGWINDALDIFPISVNNANDGDILVEIGTYFGQSACFMGELIKNSGKQIKFDTFDTFEALDSSMRAGYHPPQFIEYRFSETNMTAPMSEIVKSHFNSCGVANYVNLIICDGIYSYKFYNDSTVSLFYIDGINEKNTLNNLLQNFWPKIKSGGIIAGDDIIFDDVKYAVNDFIKNLDENEYLVNFTDLSYKITKK